MISISSNKYDYKATTCNFEDTLKMWLFALALNFLRWYTQHTT